MCECKKEMEDKLLANFKEKAPGAKGHAVELTGYTFVINRKTLIPGIMPFMTLEARAEFPLKKGGSKMKKYKENMLLSFCPFCGEKLTEQ